MSLHRCHREGLKQFLSAFCVYDSQYPYPRYICCDIKHDNVLLLSDTRCEGGKYFDTTTNECKDCIIGEYQPPEFEDLCLPCPDGDTTAVAGSIGSSSCRRESHIGYMCMLAIPHGIYSFQHAAVKCKDMFEGLFNELSKIKTLNM